MTNPPQKLTPADIKRIRQELGYTSAEKFAKALGCSPRTVKYAESPKQKISRLLARLIILTYEAKKKPVD